MPCVAALRPSLHCFFFVPCQQGVALAEAAAEMDALGEWADLAERKAAADGSVEEARAAADTLAAEVEGRVAAVEGELADVEGQLAQAQDGQAAAGGAGGRTTGCGCALALNVHCLRHCGQALHVCKWQGQQEPRSSSSGVQPPRPATRRARSPIHPWRRSQARRPGLSPSAAGGSRASQAAEATGGAARPLQPWWS